MSELKDFPLGFTGFTFSDLYTPERLKELHAEYWKYAGQVSPDLKPQFDSLKGSTDPLPKQSEILIESARVLGDFVAKLFNISNYTSRIKTETLEKDPIFRFKREFLNIRVFKRFTEPPIDSEEFKTLDEKVRRILSHEPPTGKSDEEQRLSEIVTFFVDVDKRLQKGLPIESTEQQRIQNLLSHLHGNSNAEKIQLALKTFEDWCTHVWINPIHRVQVEKWASYVRPQKLDFENLVPVDRPSEEIPELMVGKHLHPRDGFKLTDARMNQKQMLREVDYCIYCHQREKDSCSKGFPEKNGGFKKNPLGIDLEGCPLDERISEMHYLRKKGEVIGALAMIMLDNPMCPGTGHRICNDCMRGCIFQKQDPVNIPQNETGILTEVLNLPYGFEIYSLFTRFNPLNQKRPYALPYNGNDVLVVGLGPAGYTLTHYLANEGFGVVGIDALKLEPVDATLTGRGRAFPKPIQNFSELKKDLDERILMGFGGVSEYGITVRWDKNFLAVIYLTLLRRNNLRFFGGVRFGGTLNLDEAWDLGFKHVGIATGAGRPTIIPMKNNLIRGIRKASDFLMALQLTGAFKKTSMANLQVRLPAIVVGGGLTAVDTATELFAYYPIQVEKVLERFELLSRQFGEESVWQMCDEEEKETLAEFIEHGKQVREERRAAEREKRKPDFITMVRQWGGVSIAYRKKMTDSPAYRLNYEEVTKALEEGIGFIECLVPVEAKRDRFGAVEAMVCKKGDGTQITLPARTVCVAAGTSPNTIYEQEYPGSFKLDEHGHFFRKYQATKTDEGKWDLHEVSGKSKEAFFLSYQNVDRFVTFYGDNHPDFAGNVVKAMASAKHGAPHVAKLFWNDILLADKSPADFSKYESLCAKLEERLVPRIVRVIRLTPTIVEVIVRGHYAARRFEPGQFYRLQNYETYSHAIEGSRLTLEGLALTGAWVDKERDLLSMIVLEMGASSRLCATLKAGDPVVVMGPTGTPSDIPANQTVLLVGGGLGNAVLLSIAQALRANNSKVIYFAGYKKTEDLFKQDEIESVTDQVIWASDSGTIPARRPQDLSFTGNIVKAMTAYADGDLQKPVMFPFNKIDHIICIGSDRMMAAVTAARHDVLKQYLKPDHIGIASINSSMQCMMKEVCAQCLQRHVDPVTGKETFVFSCNNQDQLMDQVDFQNLNERLKMNSLAEKLTNRYVDYLFQKGKLERV